MEGITATFTKKLGPLQVWMWAAIAVGAYVIYAWYTKTGIFAPATASTSSAAAPPMASVYSPTATDTSSLPGGGLVGGMGATPPVGVSNGAQPIANPAPGWAARDANQSPPVPWITVPTGSWTSPAGTGVVSNAGGGRLPPWTPVSGPPDPRAASQSPGVFPGLRR
jgi:hypothetical protein